MIILDNPGYLDEPPKEVTLGRVMVFPEFRLEGKIGRAYFPLLKKKLKGWWELPGGGTLQETYPFHTVHYQETVAQILREVPNSTRNEFVGNVLRRIDQIRSEWCTRELFRELDEELGMLPKVPYVVEDVTNRMFRTIPGFRDQSAVNADQFFRFYHTVYNVPYLPGLLLSDEHVDYRWVKFPPWDATSRPAGFRELVPLLQGIFNDQLKMRKVGVAEEQNIYKVVPEDGRVYRDGETLAPLSDYTKLMLIHMISERYVKRK